MAKDISRKKLKRVLSDIDNGVYNNPQVFSQHSGVYKVLNETGKVILAPVPHLAARSVILDNIDNGIDFRFIPYDGISNNGIPISWEPHSEYFVMKNPYLTNPTSYDDCILTWERVVKPTFLQKVM
jgi:hypothetical protein